jgi:hypothetical protein
VIPQAKWRVTRSVLTGQAGQQRPFLSLRAWAFPTWGHMPYNKEPEPNDSGGGPCV